MADLLPGQPVRASQLIAALERHRRRYGDLPIVGGFISQDSPPTKLVALDADDGDVDYSGKPAVALFLEA